MQTKENGYKVTQEDLALINSPDSHTVVMCQYGKDQMATLEACKRLGWKIDEVVTVIQMYNEEVACEHPIVWTFYDYADREIKRRYGVNVRRVYSPNFEDLFYRRVERVKDKSGKTAWRIGRIWGFPNCKGGGNFGYCNVNLKLYPIQHLSKELEEEYGKTLVKIVGIARDEEERLDRLNDGWKTNQFSSLAELGWSEADAYQWCEDNGLLNPSYTVIPRSGCWFCYHANTQFIKYTFNECPEHWKKLLVLDYESPMDWKSNASVRKWDKRLRLEKEGKVPSDRKFRWSMLDNFPDYIIDRDTGECLGVREVVNIGGESYLCMENVPSVIELDRDIEVDAWTAYQRFPHERKKIKLEAGQRLVEVGRINYNRVYCWDKEDFGEYKNVVKLEDLL